MKKGKLLIFSAPSGSGKTTLVNYLREEIPSIAFSVSATTRAPRGEEQNGVEYYFMSLEEFQQRVENDEFLIMLQPKFDINSEKIKGAEALIRWNYKNKEFLPPSRFIPFFEKDGTISKIDDIVLRKVCEAFARWKKEGKELYPISVNLSRDRLYDVNLIDHLTGIVDSFGVDHKLIDFELTESASYDNTEQMIQVLNDLRSRGFKISMDDFGTGYSSFSLLTQMPLDTLKIDKSFVDKVGTQDEKEHDIVVIRHIIALARELDFVCLAEGAEMRCQVDKLRTLGCEVIQGYYYSKPIPVCDYEERYLLRNAST